MHPFATINSASVLGLGPGSGFTSSYRFLEFPAKGHQLTKYITWEWNDNIVLYSMQANRKSLIGGSMATVQMGRCRELKN